MPRSLKILVVEDEMIIGAKISLYLEQLGHEVLALLPRGEDAIQFIENNTPELVLLDINLKGVKDGIEIGHEIKKKKDIPIIFLTANTDDSHFNRAKETQPEAFISKPFKKRDLQRAIDLMISRLGEKVSLPLETVPETDEAVILEDRIFVRDKDKRIKVMTKDILYLESDRNYTKVFTRDKEFIIAITMKKVEERLPAHHFLRIHRSYIINLLQIDAIADAHLVIHKKAIPIGKGNRTQLLERLRLL